ncbi:hypothetical protein ScalyP_jg5210 [Parmales sp. scaly parma]|nr:hypothetical protein ScalyP_jg5210 [Parmales sp. scaly parma]|tara:strand:+ start:353 stop:1051 length:699 start_codon:yes stop_codon:yes gene_type:complete
MASPTLNTTNTTNPSPPPSPIASPNASSSNDESASQQINDPTEVFHNEQPINPSLKRCISSEAVWTLSTAKPGNGVDQILDNNNDTYWQSDGGQPHLINIHFHQKTSVLEIAFYLDFNLDESYTPKKLSVRAGSSFHDLVEVKTVTLEEPVGWVSIRLEDMELSDNLAGNASNFNYGVRAHFIQVCVVSMHQNGRDTHVRQAKIFGPRTVGGAGFSEIEFKSVAFTQFETIR